MTKAGPSLIGFLPLVIFALGLAAVVVYSRRAGDRGLAGETIVRCAQGHLFTTIWIPGISLKAVRLGLVRWQRCPVGRHLTFVTPVNPESLTPEQRARARLTKDTSIP